LEGEKGGTSFMSCRLNHGVITLRYLINGFFELVSTFKGSFIAVFYLHRLSCAGVATFSGCELLYGKVNPFTNNNSLG